MKVILGMSLRVLSLYREIYYHPDYTPACSTGPSQENESWAIQKHPRASACVSVSSSSAAWVTLAARPWRLMSTSSTTRATTALPRRSLAPSIARARSEASGPARNASSRWRTFLSDFGHDLCRYPMKALQISAQAIDFGQRYDRFRDTETCQPAALINDLLHVPPTGRERIIQCPVVGADIQHLQRKEHVQRTVSPAGK